MSRGRKRKSEKGNFSEASMKNAVRQVLEGENGKKLSLRKAAMNNNVKFQTLQRYVKKAKEHPGLAIGMAANYKHRLVFTEAQESELVDYILHCSKMCYGQSTKNVRELAYELAKINKINMPSSWEVKKKAGIDWLQGFMKRNKQLSVRQPEGCSLSRATSFNEHSVGLFFDNLEAALGRSVNFADGSRIYNLDETGTTTVQRPHKIVAAKGAKQVSQCTSAERGTLVTTCCIISASGNSLPPVMVFPRKKVKEHMISGAPPGTLGLPSRSGWMTGDIFPSVMHHFVKHSGSSKENPTILIFDNHESHLNIETLNIAKENGVTIVTLPPHCSHKLQPLDIAVFYSFKSHYNAAVDSWLLHHPGKPATIYQIASFVVVAHERSMTPTNIKSGFKKAGIYPFDRNIFTTDEFLTSAVTDRRPASSGPFNIDEIVPVPMEDIPDTASTSRSATPSLPTSPTPHKTLGQFSVTPEMLKGYPKVAEQRKRKRRQPLKSCIVTDTPEKEKIRKRQLEKKNKNPSKKMKKDQNPEPNDEDFYIDEDDKLPVDTSGSLAKEPQVNDFVLVQFSSKKKVFYVGKILSPKDSDGDFEVSFLRRSMKQADSFVFPRIVDMASVSEEDIKMILPKPRFLGNTNRLKKFLNFNVSFATLDLR